MHLDRVLEAPSYLCTKIEKPAPKKAKNELPRFQRQSNALHLLSLLSLPSLPSPPSLPRLQLPLGLEAGLAAEDVPSNSNKVCTSLWRT